MPSSHSLYLYGLLTDCFPLCFLVDAVRSSSIVGIGTFNGWQQGPVASFTLFVPVDIARSADVTAQSYLAIFPLDLFYSQFTVDYF
jgi:hypothetical protein